MSRYPGYEESRRSFGINVLGTLVVEVEADDGTVGFGVTTAGEPGAWIVERIWPASRGRQVTDIEKIWDRCSGRHSSTAARAWCSTSSAPSTSLSTTCSAAAAGAGLPPARRRGPRRTFFYATGAQPDLAQQMGFVGGKWRCTMDRTGGRGPASNIDELATCARRSATTSG